MAEILIVEDNAVNRTLIATLVSRAGYTYALASNGKEALQALAHGGFKLVLMDLMMPVMDGYAAIKAIRADADLQSLPIVALTASSNSDEEAKCYAARCDGYIAKPYAKDRILGMLSNLLPKAVAVAQGV